jgi:shikimate dehydrogenase
VRSFGLLGYPLTHSFSKKYFTEKFLKEGISDARYELYPVKNADKIRTLALEDINLVGMNVTIPYKETILPLLDELDTDARKIGAVNCVQITRINNKPFLKGYNTDVFGFSNAIKPFLESQHQKALVLGTGGSSKAVHYVLSRLGIECYSVSRNKQPGKVFTYDELNEAILANCRLIVNTTPLGMFPEIDQCPDLPFEYIGPGHFVFDLVYNPAQTLLLERAAAKGALTQNGLSMLRLQAEKSWEIWNR